MLVQLDALNTFPVLETERLILRRSVAEDVDFMFEIKSNDALLTYMDKDPHKDKAETKALMEKINQSFEDKKGINWVLVNKETNEAIGDCGIWLFDLVNARGEIGYTLLKKAWGKGYMTEGLNAILDYAFGTLKFHSIEANINPANDGSRKLLLKAGFRKEAYFTENYHFNGQFLDSEIYSLIEKWR